MLVFYDLNQNIKQFNRTFMNLHFNSARFHFSLQTRKIQIRILKNTNFSKLFMHDAKHRIKVIILLGSLCSNIVTARICAQDNQQKKNGYIVIPALFYTPETKIAGGLSIIAYFRGNRPAESRPSTVQPTLIFTQKKQITSSLKIERYLFDDAYRLNLETGYKKYPDSFFGIGQNTKDSMEEQFTPNIFELTTTLYKRFNGSVHLGLIYAFRHDKIDKVESQGLLSQKNIAGSEGGQSSGLGVVINLDTRNNIFYPEEGRFYQASFTVFNKNLGSDFNFSNTIFDLRNYYPLRKKTVLALQGYASFIAGAAPFQLLSKFGGEDMMRGYFEGRFRDKHALIVQMEVRQRLLGRFGFVGFLGAGQVANTLKQVDLNKFKLSAGFGFRFKLSKNEGINARVDFGFIGGSPGPYVTINEAF